MLVWSHFPAAFSFEFNGIYLTFDFCYIKGLYAVTRIHRANRCEWKWTPRVHNSFPSSDLESWSINDGHLKTSIHKAVKKPKLNMWWARKYQHNIVTLQLFTMIFFTAKVLIKTKWAVKNFFYEKNFPPKSTLRRFHMLICINFWERKKILGSIFFKM